jgi:hypothetical protein
MVRHEFTCPECRSHRFGSSNCRLTEGPLLRRHCDPCGFSFDQTDDHLYFREIEVLRADDGVSVTIFRKIAPGTVVLLLVLLLCGCATERQMSFGEVPIIRINQKMLNQKAGGLGTLGLVTYEPPVIYYSAELNEMQAVATVVHEGLGHLHVYWTGDARIWDTIDRLAAKDVYGMCKFPVASDRHPSKQVFAWDRGDHAQEVRAIYAATVEARKSNGKY